jgi:hypothetical protein
MITTSGAKSATCAAIWSTMSSSTVHLASSWSSVMTLPMPMISAARASSAFLLAMISSRPASVTDSSGRSLRHSSTYLLAWMRPPWVRMSATISSPRSACRASVPPQLVMVSAGWAKIVMIFTGFAPDLVVPVNVK